MIFLEHHKPELEFGIQTLEFYLSLVLCLTLISTQGILNQIMYTEHVYIPGDLIQKEIFIIT